MADPRTVGDVSESEARTIIVRHLLIELVTQALASSIARMRASGLDSSQAGLERLRRNGEAIDGETKANVGAA